MRSNADRMTMTIIETDRLIVRALAPEDVEPLAALWSDPAATAYLGGPRRAGDVIRILGEELAQASQPTLNQWPTIEKASGRLVGDCGLLEKEIAGRAEIELTYVLAPWAWGRGLATEVGGAIRDHAVAQFGCKRLVALIHPDNRASARVAAKLGFRLESELHRPHGLMHLHAFAAPPGLS